MSRWKKFVVWVGCSLFCGLFWAIIISLILTICCQDVSAAEISNNLAVKAIIGEASGEGYRGMLAVACGIRNRRTLKGVYGLDAKHIDNEPEWVWALARKAWEESEKVDIVNGADHWESADFKIPPWAKKMRIVAKVGKHIFYRKAGGQNKI